MNTQFYGIMNKYFNSMVSVLEKLTIFFNKYYNQDTITKHFVLLI